MEVSIYELLAAARESAKSDYIKGDSILCEKRFHPDTHYMVEMELLENDNRLGEKGNYIRKFLSEPEYLPILQKQEYGVLQAVGMTNKQLNLCLQLQGLMFTVGTICVALIIGLPLGYALFSYAKHNGIFGMNIYHVPIVPIFIMIFFVGLLQIVLSCVLSSNLKKETLVERIRYQG